MSNDNIKKKMSNDKIVEELKNTDIALVEFNNKHFISVFNDKSVFCTETKDKNGNFDLEILEKKHFMEIYNNREVYGPKGDRLKWQGIADFWYGSENRRYYKNIIFEPNNNDETNFNMWRGFYIHDDSYGSFSHIRYHLLHVWCNGNIEQYKYLLKWFAHLVQYPEEIPGVALVIKGEKGTGKTGFIDALGNKILGHMYIKVTNQKHLTGNFNYHLFGKLLIVSEEAFWAGNKSAEGALKSMITDPTIMIERKGYDARLKDNYARFIFLTNEDFAVPATYDERRFFALRISSKHKNDNNYFQKLYSAMNNNEIIHFFNFLKRFKFNKIDIFKPPFTDILFEDINSNMDIFDKWLYDLIDYYSSDGEFNKLDELDWFKSCLGIGFSRRIRMSSLHTSYKKYIEHAKTIGVYIGCITVRSATMLTQKLTNGKSGSYSFKKSRDSQGTFLIMPSAEDAKKIFEKKFSCRVKWSQPTIKIDDVPF